MKFGFDWPCGFRGEKIFEIVDDDRWTPEAGAWVYYKVKGKAFGSGELRIEYPCIPQFYYIKVGYKGV